MRVWLGILAGVLPLANAGSMTAQAAPVPPSVSPAPQFSRHVVAVFSRLGCNSGACHGAVQGKNGLRLSLFGAKPEFDHVQLVRDQTGRQIDRLEPEQSLLLLKATATVPHGGGRLTGENSCVAQNAP